MMTPEKPTMANLSSGKRDRISDHTDKPVTTRNTRDTKLLCDDDKDAIGKGIEGKLIEMEQKLNSVMIDNADNGGVSTSVKPDQKEVIDVDDLDLLIASGGLEDSPGSDTEENVPKTLFSRPKDKFDERDHTKPVSTSTSDDGLTSKSTPTKINQKDQLKDSTTTSTENNTKDNNKNNKKNEKNNKKTDNKKTDNDKKQATDSKKQPSKKDEKDGNDKAVLTLKEGFKPPTQMWKDIPLATKEISGLAYKVADKEKKLLLHMSSFLKHFSMSTDDKISRDKWAQMFKEASLLNGRSHKFLKRFGIALASTDPTELFLPHQFNGTILLRGCTENAWAGAYTVYGAG